MDVGDWLRNLGLGQYEDVFRDNGVDGAVLPKLTVDDLKEMGVAGVGHRRKIIAAIEDLSVSAAVTTRTIKPASTTSPASVPQPTDSAERRQLTVMFCDLVGSTALSARLDPEDLRGIIGAYHRCCAGMIERNGGFVAKYMGDGVLAYFGYPQAHEHDSERAVQAGLTIVEAAPKLVTAAGSPLHVRIGIATGSSSGTSLDRGKRKFLF
jgi:class 3 adenylate cyclase